jgi:branched-chain amino acid transport system substrate-binding protein
MLATRRRALAAAVAVGALVAAGCSSSSKPSGSGSATTAAGHASGNTASAPGVTPTTVSVGLITSETGVASPEYVPGIVKGAQARFDLQNAQGGVHGRTLTLNVKDDQSSPTGFSTAAQDLASGGNFGIIADSAFVFGGYRPMQQQGVPVVGAGVDGPEWGEQPNTNMFSVLPVDPKTPQYTTEGLFVKDRGGTNVAGFGYSVSPSSTAAAKGVAKIAEAVGIKAGLIDTSIPFGGVNAGPIALEMKSAGVDSAIMQMDNNTNFAIVTAAKQAGVPLKVPISATGYGQSLLDQPAAVDSAQGGYFATICDPVELQTSQTKNWQAALQKYEGFTGVPGFDWCEGYITADLMIKGLEQAGQNPTRQSFINNLRQVSSYNPAGLLPNTLNFTLAAFGKAPQNLCGYYPQLQGTKFVLVPNDHPVCGTLIPNSNMTP